MCLWSALISHYIALVRKGLNEGWEYRLVTGDRSAKRVWWRGSAGVRIWLNRIEAAAYMNSAVHKLRLIAECINIMTLIKTSLVYSYGNWLKALNEPPFSTQFARVEQGILSSNMCFIYQSAWKGLNYIFRGQEVHDWGKQRRTVGQRVWGHQHRRAMLLYSGKSMRTPNPMFRKI